MMSKAKDKDNSKSKKVFLFLTPAKYILIGLFFLLSIRITHDFGYSLIGVVEVLFVFILANYISIKNTVIASILSGLFMFILGIQAGLLFFSGMYLNMIMIANLASIEMLRGRAFQYGSIALLVLILIFIPHKPLLVKQFKSKIPLIALFFLFSVDIVFSTALKKSEYSPFFAIYTLAQENRRVKMLKARIKDFGTEGAGEEFFQMEIADGIDKPKELPDYPNVVIIFMEGCSQNVIEDERNIMPNIATFQNEGLSFDNYYNHTAATYRGLFGQLYSAHSYYDDAIEGFVSVEEILSDKGYETKFINPEPTNTLFTKYLKKMQFDVSSGNFKDDLMPDQQNYDLVFDALKEAEESNTPNLIVTYTVFTHVGFDSPDKKYGDGANRLLNRFYNTDCAFGDFISRVKEAGYDENTIFVLTTDHASCRDDDYTTTFSGYYERPAWFCDEVPFTIYYKGIKPEWVDANGRNSLCLAPTLLDYMDISEPNYFLGESLFVEDPDNKFDTIFCIPDGMLTNKTNDGLVGDLSEDEQKDYEERFARFLSVMGTE